MPVLPALVLLTSLVAETGTSIVAAGQRFDVGRPVVLWNQPGQGFDGYAEECLEDRAKATSPCCRSRFKRFGVRKGVTTLADLQGTVSQLVLHHDGCVNSRSCFYSMHDMPRPDGGCGLSAHFMIDADGTIYQTLDLVERAYHAEQANPISIGVEICNRADASRNELDRLPADYRTRPVRDVVINGHTMHAFDFRPEQYRSIIALARTVTRVFPRVRPVIPEKDGAPLLETLADPSAFAGIVGHLHVDRQRHKWDPGAFDWKSFVAALNGYYIPLPVAGFSRFPLAELPAIDRAAKVVFEAVEERSSATFPIGEGGLYHSGVNLRGTPGAPVVAPARGTIVAARLAHKGKASTSFVLIRHDVTVGTEPVRFFSLLAHLDPSPNPAAVPWLQRLAGSRDRRAASTLQLGDVALLDVPIEAGEPVGVVGFVRRGSEVGPETRFEIFTTERLPDALARFFREADGANDGAFVRRGYVLDLLDAAGARQPTEAALAEFFRGDSLDARQALRRLAVRHPHEWGRRQTEAAFTASPELSQLAPSERRRVYDEAVRPYLWGSDAISVHAGLPADEIVWSYNPIAFLAVLAAAAGPSLPRWPAADVSDRDVAPAARPSAALAALVTPPPEPAPEPPTFGPLVRVRIVPKNVADIPLIDLPQLDDSRR